MYSTSPSRCRSHGDAIAVCAAGPGREHRHRLAGPGDGGDLTGPQVSGSDEMVLTVRDVQRAPVGRKRHALRAAERRLGECTVGTALRAGTDHVDQLAAERCHEHPVAARVGHEQPFAHLVGQHLAREAQHRRQRRSDIEQVAERRGVDEPVLAVFLGHDGNGGLQCRVDALAGVVAHHLACRIDHHHGRPRVHAIGGSQQFLAVVHDRVLAAVSDRGLAHGFRCALAVELRPVDGPPPRPRRGTPARSGADPG